MREKLALCWSARMLAPVAWRKSKLTASEGRDASRPGWGLPAHCGTPEGRVCGCYAPQAFLCSLQAPTPTPPLHTHTHTSCAAPCAVKDAAWAAQEVGSCRVAPLDWSDPACFASFQPPYDFILAADCVYSELAGEEPARCLCTPSWRVRSLRSLPAGTRGSEAACCRQREL